MQTSFQLRRYRLSGALLLVCLFLASAFGAAQFEALVQAQETVHLVRSPYLQNLSTSTVTIVWTTTESGPSEVRYSTDLSYSNVVPASSRFVSTNAGPPYDDYFEHAATLTGLTADTAFNYAIYTQGVQLATDEQRRFQTHPGLNGCTFDFAAFGDTGRNAQPTWDVRDQAVARGFDFALIMGDLAYGDGKYEELEMNFFNVYQDVLTNKMIWPAIGNHEYHTAAGAPYLDVYHLPEQALRPADHERYYSMDYGNAHFVFLDTNTPLKDISDQTLDDMADWLVADLTANDSFWTIVAMHHPWYVSDNRGHPNEIRDSLVPLFEEHNVDLVLTGHDHLYERTWPIKEDALSSVAEGGVVYITNGEGGGRGTTGYNFYNPQPDWSASRSDNLGSYTHVYVDNGVMSVITIDDQGNVLDPDGSNDPGVIIDRSDEPGAACNASVSGAVYEDSDDDGAFSPGDMPLAGVKIDLSDGQSATTAGDGAYQFVGLPTGSYTITETDLPGYASVADVQGNNDNVISVTLAVGSDVVGQNFLDKVSAANLPLKLYLPLILKSSQAASATGHAPPRHPSRPHWAAFRL